MHVEHTRLELATIWNSIFADVSLTHYTTITASAALLVKIEHPAWLDFLLTVGTCCDQIFLKIQATCFSPLNFTHYASMHIKLWKYPFSNFTIRLRYFYMWAPCKNFQYLILAINEEIWDETMVTWAAALAAASRSSLLLVGCLPLLQTHMQHSRDERLFKPRRYRASTRSHS